VFEEKIGWNMSKGRWTVLAPNPPF